MYNSTQQNDHMIKQHTDIPYDSKDKKRPLEEQNTIVVSHKKGLWARLKQLFKRKQAE